MIDDTRCPSLHRSLRPLVLMIAGLEAIVWLFFVGNGLFAGISDEARSINRDVAVLATAVFAVSGAPALLLALLRRWLGVALTLALLPLLALIVSALLVI